MKYLKYFDKHNNRETYQETNTDGTFIHYCEDQEHLHYLNSEQSIIDTISGINNGYNPYFNQWTMLDYIRDHYNLELVEKFYTNEDNDNDIYTLGDDIDLETVYSFDSFEINNNVLAINDNNVGLSMTSTVSNGFENINTDTNIVYNASGDRDIRAIRSTTITTRLAQVWANIVVGLPLTSTGSGCDLSPYFLSQTHNINEAINFIYLNGGLILRLVEICTTTGMPDVAIYMTVNYTDYLFPGQNTSDSSLTPRTREGGISNTADGKTDFPLMYILVFFEDSTTSLTESSGNMTIYDVIYSTNSRAIGILPIQQFAHTPYYYDTSYYSYYGIS